VPRTIERSIEIAAPASRVWSVMVDVEAMPTWSSSMTSVVLETPGPLEVGSVALVVQPKLSPTRWTVVDLVPGESFTWRSKGLGTTSTGRHVIEPASVGRVAVHLSIEFSGLSSRLTGIMAESYTRNALTFEAEGLKEYCEATRRARR
jgi:uncharacterized protein YndB with AHSA1/START domain